MELKEVNVRGQAQTTLLGIGVMLVLLTIVAVGLAKNGTHTAAPDAFQDELQIKIGSNGFAPSETQHAAGTFAIAVENTVEAEEYRLMLKAADGTVLKEIPVQKGSAAWTVTLAAGQYTLTEASHAEWLCRITVQ